MAAKTDFKVPLMQRGGRLIWRQFREEPASKAASRVGRCSYLPLVIERTIK
jgi:hypothetical protein